MKARANALISIKPAYADAIVSGAKTVELRRKIPPLAQGACLWIYATLPVGAVIGHALVSKVDRGPPSEIWQRHGNDAAIERPVFDAYFDGAEEAIGIVLSEVARVRPVSLERLKGLRSNFQPPQVLMRLTEAEARSIQKASRALAL